jgi:hypothetical protein
MIHKYNMLFDFKDSFREGIMIVAMASPHAFIEEAGRMP